MPHRRTKFNRARMTQIYINGHQLRSWCKKDSNSEYSGFCFLCCKPVQCAYNGVKQIHNHAEGKNTKNLQRLGLEKDRSIFLNSNSREWTKWIIRRGDVVKGVVLQSKTLKDQMTTAEILWVLKVSSAGTTFSSCDDTPDLFKAMFPGPVSEEFRMSRTKASYMHSDGLGSYFRENIAKHICDNKVFYTIQFDETGNFQGKKQCDVLIRFWNSQTGQISTQYLKYIIFGHAKGKYVANALLDTLAETKLLIASFSAPVNQK